ncbi:MAG: hypothetical protein M1819_001652 [Sarea resinae]|nr:MAG: hypothetical protein M1819_001652 [Sarea resinae]
MPSAVIPQAQEGPLAKRQRTGDTSLADNVKPIQASRIFAPFRTVGLVSPTDVPFTSVPLGKTSFQVTTSAGRSLQTYDLRRGLNLVFLSRPQTPEIITATTAWKDRVFAAWGGEVAGSAVGVWVLKRGKKVGELEIPSGHRESVKQILIFGSWIVGCCSNQILVWKSASYEHYTTLVPLGANTENAGQVLTGGVCNMPTFLNKIFVGREDGGVEIWNLSTGKLIYTILPPSSDSGPVTALEPTPALSLLAIAYANGALNIHDVKSDKPIIMLKSSNANRSPVTCISFRTDGLGAGEDGRKAGVMATSGVGDGDVTLWDLNEGGRVMGVLRGAHNPPSSSDRGVSGGVSKVEFLSGQPVLMTSGLDNALKSWIFDESPFSPVPRILHSRSGHAAPVTRLDFLPSDADGAEAGGKWLISSGRDRSLWAWSLRRDGQSTELSQGNVRSKAKRLGILGAGVSSTEPTLSLEDLKAPEITCLASSLNRDGGMGSSVGKGSVWTNASNKKNAVDATASGATGWESVVTGHKGDKFARTWFWGRKKAGRWAFETGDGTEVKSVAISPCGTFALVGSLGGGVDMFNLQSGQHRQRFPARLTPAQAKRLKLQQGNPGDLSKVQKEKQKFGPGQGKHTRAVTGVMVDGLNRTVISCSLDGRVKFWDFTTGMLQDEIDWHPMSAITGSRYHRSSDLIALSCDDLSIRVVDIETKKLVRELWGCSGQITDFCFSNDGRWIVAASVDSTIRVWDLPTGHLIDAIRVNSTCTALAFSNTGEFLATAHADSIGVNIWNNRTLFTHVPTRHISEDEITDVSGPTITGEGGQGLIDAAFEDDVPEEFTPETAGASLEQLSQDLTTLSLVPRSRWQTLLHLDAIKQRNKPKEPPKAPEKAPFFLPSLKDTTTPLTTTDPASVVSAAERSRITALERGAASSSSSFTALLHSGTTETGTLAPALELLKSLPPAAADIQIRSLSSLAPYTELVAFVAALTERLREKRDYELVQAWMAVFLKIHGEVVAAAVSNSDYGDGQGDGDGDGDIYIHDVDGPGHEKGGAGLLAALQAWRREQDAEARRLESLVGYCSGVVGFLRSTRG